MHLDAEEDSLNCGAPACIELQGGASLAGKLSNEASLTSSRSGRGVLVPDDSLSGSIVIIPVRAVQRVSVRAYPTVASSSQAVGLEPHPIRVAAPILVRAQPTAPFAWCCRTCTAPALMEWAVSHQRGPSRPPKDLAHFAQPLSAPGQRLRFESKSGRLPSPPTPKSSMRAIDWRECANRSRPTRQFLYCVRHQRTVLRSDPFGSRPLISVNRDGRRPRQHELPRAGNPMRMPAILRPASLVLRRADR
jgi:hypothetical protein